MTIVKAIKILTDIRENDDANLYEDERDALLMGIEALKGIQQAREQFPEFSPFPLPGETLPERR